MKIIATNTYRLYDVSAQADENGCFGLESFADTAYNEVIDNEELDETLCQLTDVLFGQSGCSHFEITEDVETAKNGKLCLDLGNNDWLEVQDIVDKINVAPEESRLFVLVNATRTEYQWVAALSEGTVYSDCCSNAIKVKGGCHE